MLKELIKEIKEKQRGENITYNQRVVLEQTWLKDKIAESAMCEKCKVQPANTLDHIVPKFILKDMGIDIDRHFNPDNYAAYCKFCNAGKSNHLDFSNPKTKSVLMNYLQNL